MIGAGHIAAIAARGIPAPPMGSRKTLCPKCSDMRIKRGERCLSLYPSPGWIDWRCHHCGWHDGALTHD